MKRLLFYLVWMGSVVGIQIPSHHVFPPHLKIQPPWFTGPLLAPSGLTVPQGHFNIEPYLYITANTGKYDDDWHRIKTKSFWNNSFQVPVQIGITPQFDCLFSPTLFYNYTEGAAQWAVGDLPIGIDIQLYRHNRLLSEWGTGLLLRIEEVLPIGKYNNLNPKKHLTDAGGGGTWQTNVTLVWGNLFPLGGLYFVTWRSALQYTFSTPVQVHNLNVYGGGKGTRGKVYPGQSLQFDTAIEFTLSKNWAFAMDIVGSWTEKNRFEGKTSIKNSAPASIQFSLAPAIEYNWSSELGLIAGCWFSVAGRNSTQFISAVTALNFFY